MIGATGLQDDDDDAIQASCSRSIDKTQLLRGIIKPYDIHVGLPISGWEGLGCNEDEITSHNLGSDVTSSRYSEVFADGLGRFTGGKVGVHLWPGAQPVFMRARPLAYALRGPVERTLDQLVRDGILTPVERSDWATPIVPVVKKDGSIRICADYKLTLNKKLELPDLRNVMLSCKTIYNLVKNNNTIWRTFSKDRIILRNCADSKYPNNLSWYNRCRISYNWSQGYYKLKVVIHHYINYMPWINFHNSELLVVSVGSELHCYPTNVRGLPNCREALWRLDVPKIQRHDVRTNDISRFIIKNNLIVCGNRDGCVAVYGANNLQRRPRLLCHIKDCHDNGEAEVTAVEVANSRNQCLIITGSSDTPSLYLCNLKTEANGNEILTALNSNEQSDMNISMSGNVGAKCLALNNAADKLAIGLSGNSKPLLLDVNNGQFLVTADATKNRKQAVRDIIWHNENTITYVTHSGVLQMMDIRSQEVVYDMMDPFQSTLYCVKSDGHNAIVVGSAEYSRCVLFDSRNCMHHVQMYFTQRDRKGKSSPVYSLDFDSSKLITAVDRGVGVLDFNIDSSSVQQRDYSHVFN